MILTALSAQDRVLLSKENYNEAVKTSINISDPEISIIKGNERSMIKASFVAPSETIIGSTVFDSQTNKLLQHRIIRYEDGTIGAIWMRGMEDASFPDRGTGYNFNNGTEWGQIPDERLESFRAGWPSYAPWGPNGEAIVCHNYNAGEIFFLTRDQKGAGEWNENPFIYTLGPDMVSHPKIITAGAENNTIHLLANSYAEYLGQSMAMLYSRSLDGGQTWDIQNVVLEGTGIEYYNAHTRDVFVLAEERAGTIALLCGVTWHDLFMLKSTDNGDTWEKIIIWEHPYPFFDWGITITDTFFCMDNSASIALDYQGKAHVVFGISRVLHDTPGSDFWVDTSVDGIAYWNEDMETFSNDIHALAPPELGYANSEMIIDYNLIGWMQDVNGNGTIDLTTDTFYYRQFGTSTMPTISIDDQGRIFVIFSSTTETYEYVDYNYKHLWVRAFDNSVWGPFVDLTEGFAHIYDECIHPVLASSSDDNIHYIYSIDNIPGIAQRGDHDFVETYITYGSCPKSDILTGINKDRKIQSSDLEINPIPNPTSGEVKINYLLNKEIPVKICLLDIQGQLIENIYPLNKKRGLNSLKLNLSHLPDGIYLIRLQAGNQVETAKVVLMK